MTKRFIWLILMLAISGILAACGSNERPAEPVDVDEVAPVSQATPVEEAAPAEEPKQPQADQPAQEAQVGVQGGQQAPEAPQLEAAAPDVGIESAPAEEPPQPVNLPAREGKYGLVAGSISDRGFNQLAWEGLQRAADDFGVLIQHSETTPGGNTGENFAELLNQGFDRIISVGFGLAQAEKAAAQANPDAIFLNVDFPSLTGNDVGLLFSVDEPAFMAGYLAASMTETGMVCTFGGKQTPPVLMFMVGYEHGVKYFNQQTGANVQVLGWQTNPDNPIGGGGIFSETFVDAETGRAIAADLFNQGCDIIFPVAGGAGLGAAEAAQERGLKVIGVDADQALTNPHMAEVYLTSVQKNIDAVVYEAVKRLENGEFNANDNYRTNFIGTLENKGVGLAPFYGFDSQIPQAAKDALAQIEQQFIAGTLSSGWPVGAAAPSAAPAPEAGGDAQTEPAPASVPAPGGPGALTLEALRNATYQSNWTAGGLATLTNGEYREAVAPGSATETVVQMSDFLAFGDLTGNGVDDAAVVLVTDPGGSGTFVDLAAVVNANGVPVNLALFALGDRAQVQSVAIQNGKIVVDMITHGPNDPMCCPSQAVTKRFSLGMLVDGAVQPDMDGGGAAPQSAFVGTYQTDIMPAASSPGLQITLTLNADGSVEVSNDYLNGKPPIVESGNWQDNGDGTVTVSVTGRPDGMVYNQPDVITFGLSGSELTAVAWDTSVHGSVGLTLYRQ